MDSCTDSGVELRIWLKQGKEKAQTRKGKKTAGKEKRLLARKKDCWQGKKTADKDFRESA